MHVVRVLVVIKKLFIALEGCILFCQRLVLYWSFAQRSSSSPRGPWTLLSLFEFINTSVIFCKFNLFLAFSFVHLYLFEVKLDIDSKEIKEKVKDIDSSASFNQPLKLWKLEIGYEEQPKITTSSKKLSKFKRHASGL